MDRIIVDANSLGYASHCATKLNVAGFETQSIFGMVKSARELKASSPDATLLYLWDGHAQWRYDLYPGYKADRDKDPKQALMRANYKKAKPVIQKALQLLGIMQLTVLTAEADDMAGFMVNSLNPEKKIKLVTGDQDWLMLVKDNVTWFDPIRDSTVTIHNFMDFTGYENGRAFLDGKALQGDGSDKIGGVGGIGKGTAPLFLAQFGSVQGFFDRVDSGDYIPKKKAEQRFGLGKSNLSLEQHMALIGANSTETELHSHEEKWEGDG
jgi:DNA polymerase-1